MISEFFPAPLAKLKEARYNMNELKRSYLRRRELGFYRLRDRAAPQGVAERNETLRCHVRDEENLRGSADSLPPPERAAKAVLAVCRRLSDTGDMVFIENDAKLLLQRLPDDVKNVHYHDDETHIRLLLEKYDLVPKRGVSLAAATVRGLILTVSHKEQIGELYPQVLEMLVYGACRELFK